MDDRSKSGDRKRSRVFFFGDEKGYVSCARGGIVMSEGTTSNGCSPCASTFGGVSCVVWGFRRRLFGALVAQFGDGCGGFGL